MDAPGITYNYRVAFEDGTGDVIREELLPVFVDYEHHDAQRTMGERVVEGVSVAASPDPDTVGALLDAEDELREAADRYVSARVSSIRADLETERSEAISRELQSLDEYAVAERERIESFIEEYERKAEAGSDMGVAIRGQQERLENLEARIEARRAELRRTEQVVSLAPEVEGWCLTLSV